jgi:hypothetical protein
MVEMCEVKLKWKRGNIVLFLKMMRTMRRMRSRMKMMMTKRRTEENSSVVFPLQSALQLVVCLKPFGLPFLVQTALLCAGL